MDNKELIDAVRRLSVETGSLACLGCGWEHNCSIHGCAILRAVIAELSPAANADLRVKGGRGGGPACPCFGKERI